MNEPPVYSRAFALVILLAATNGCRGCGSPEDPPPPAGPPMPSGLLAPSLVPAPSASGAVGIAPAELFALAREKREGAWAEIQLAADAGAPPRPRWQTDSRFLSLEAMAFLHDPFATALAGFDLFVPHFFDPSALFRLAGELADREAQVRATTSVREARARWATASTFVAGLTTDEEWGQARETLLATLRDLATLARIVGGRGEGLWVLGI